MQKSNIIALPNTGFEFHPLSYLFPLAVGLPFERLVTGIRDHGLIHPIVLYEGKILDGRSRHRACGQVGVAVAYETYDGDDPLSYVIEVNNRRDLNESQRAMVATRLATLPQGRHSSGELSQEQAGLRIGVSVASIKRAKVVIENAEPEIIEAVDQGAIAVNTAAAMAYQSREEQLRRLARDLSKAAGSHRHPDDYYQTPAVMTQALLDAETFRPGLWEPACGNGAISEVLVEEYPRLKIVSSDLIDRGYGETGIDFLATKKKPARVRSLITNPPFKLIDDFALHALSLGVEKVALLTRLSWLEGRSRFDRLWQRKQLHKVWVFSERHTFWRGDEGASESSSGMTAYAWFIFGPEIREEPGLGWL
jgi:ParB-like chromosome segregation protein Spo0J